MGFTFLINCVGFLPDELGFDPLEDLAHTPAGECLLFTQGENAPPALFPVRDPRGLQDHLSIQRQDFQTRREYSSAMRQVKEAGAHRVAPPRSLLASYQKGVWAITPDTFSIKVNFAHGSEFVVEWKVGVLRRPLVEVLIGALFVDATRNQVGSP